VVRHRLPAAFTMDEARDLAIVLRAGALPAPVNILEERTVGPSLGSDSIRQGIIATLIGTLFVIIFMIIYYRFAGSVADLALIINIFWCSAYPGCVSGNSDIAGYCRLTAHGGRRG
jgi:preprotein translocase subunit SecD